MQWDFAKRLDSLTRESFSVSRRAIKRVADTRTVQQADGAAGFERFVVAPRGQARETADGLSQRFRHAKSSSIGNLRNWVALRFRFARSCHPSRNCSTVTRRTQKGSGRWQKPRASLARHMRETMTEPLCFGKKATPKPAAGNGQKWPRAGGRQMHRSGISSYKSRGKGDDSQGGHDRRRIPCQIDVAAAFGSAARIRSFEAASASFPMKEQDGLLFPMRSAKGRRPNSLRPSP